MVDAAATRRATMTRKLRECRFYLYLLPTFVLLGVFCYYPPILGLIGSFYEWNGANVKEWNGLGNFVRMAHDKVLIASIGNLVKLARLAANVEEVAVELAQARSERNRIKGELDQATRTTSPKDIDVHAKRVADRVWQLGEAFTLQTESLWFLAELLIGVVLPVALYAQRRVRESRRGLAAAALLVTLGTMLNRFNATFVGQAAVEGASYTPHWMEIAIQVGVLAGVMLVWYLAVTFLPILDEPHHAH